MKHFTIAIFPIFDYRISNVYHLYPIYNNAVDLITFYGVSTKQFMLSNDILLDISKTFATKHHMTDLDKNETRYSKQ